MLTINTNSMATFASNQINNINKQLTESAAKLASGKRINSAKDDPAGVGIIATLKSQQGSYNAVVKNLSAADSLLETASTSLNNQQVILGKMKDVATQAASDLLSADQRTALSATFVELQSQLTDTVNKANLFGQNLTGAAAANVNIQSGINAGEQTTIQAVKSDAATLLVDAASIDVSTSAGAASAMTAIDTAVATVGTNQAKIGAQQSGLDSMMATSKTMAANLEKSISNIEDVDVAAETSNLQLLQAKQQVSIQMLGMINSFPSMALSLLR